DDDRPGQERGGDVVDVVAQLLRQRRREEGHDRSGKGPTGNHLIQNVGDGVRGGVRVRGCRGAERPGLHEPATEPHHSGDDGEDGDHSRRARDPGENSLVHHGLRPHASNRARAGRVSITLEKLTFSEARISPVTAASAPARVRPPGWLASATPRSAPSAFAPTSPSIVVSFRSRGAAPSATPAAVCASACPPWLRGSAAIPAARAVQTFRARPGRRSKRLMRLAVPAMRAPEVRVSTAKFAFPPARPRAIIPPPRTAAAEIPRSFTAPVVSSPRASAFRCPFRPFAAAGWAAKSSAHPVTAATPLTSTAGARSGAGSRAAPTTAPAAAATPPARLTVLPRKFFRSHAAWPPVSFSSDSWAPAVSAAETSSR